MNKPGLYTTQRALARFGLEAVTRRDTVMLGSNKRAWLRGKDCALFPQGSPFKSDFSYWLVRHDSTQVDCPPVPWGVFGDLPPHPFVEVFDIGPGNTRRGRLLRKSPMMLGWVAGSGLVPYGKYGTWVVFARYPSMIYELVGVESMLVGTGQFRTTGNSAIDLPPLSAFATPSAGIDRCWDIAYAAAKRVFLQTLAKQLHAGAHSALPPGIRPAQFDPCPDEDAFLLPLWHEQIGAGAFDFPDYPRYVRLAEEVGSDRRLVAFYGDITLDRWAQSEAPYVCSGKPKALWFRDTKSSLFAAVKELRDPKNAVAAAGVVCHWDINGDFKGWEWFARMAAECPSLRTAGPAELGNQGVVLPPEVTALVS